MNFRFCSHRIASITRRDALRVGSAGFGYLAFAGLAAAQTEAQSSAPSGPKPHFEPRAKRVIFLCMRGGPSHVDTFDYKPRLKQDQPAHAQAFIQMHTGNFQSVRPSLGAWTLNGLGSDSQNLPGFISINPPTATGGAQNYGSSFLPAAFQGTKFTIQDSSQRNRRIDQLRRGEANPYGINNAMNQRISRREQRDQLDLRLDKSTRVQVYLRCEGNLRGSAVNLTINTSASALRRACRGPAMCAYVPLADCGHPEFHVRETTPVTFALSLAS
jgi:Protein of unknown function (DUF1501)